MLSWNQWDVELSMETRNQTQLRKELFVPENYFRTPKCASLSQETWRVPTVVRWCWGSHRYVLLPHFLVLSTKSVLWVAFSFKGSFWSLCFYIVHGKNSFHPPVWGYCIILLTFFSPWACLGNVLPLQISSHCTVHRNDAVMERTGKKIIMPLKVIINFRSASLLIRYTILLPL